MLRAQRTHNDARVENVKMELEESKTRELNDEREKKIGKCVFCACEWNQACMYFYSMYVRMLATIMYSMYIKYNT